MNALASILQALAFMAIAAIFGALGGAMLFLYACT
jgi:hypothetical protein